MPETEQKVTETTSRTADQDGSVTRENTKTLQTNDGSKTTAVNVVRYIYGFVAIVLALRFILRLFGANPGNAFVELIYSISGVFSLPFDTIFGVESIQAGDVSSVFEPSILVAIAIYALISWGVTKLLTLNEK